MNLYFVFHSPGVPHFGVESEEGEGMSTYFVVQKLPVTRSVFIQTERITGNLMSFRRLFSVSRSVWDKTERQTGNFHGLRNKKSPEAVIRPRAAFQNQSAQLQ